MLRFVTGFAIILLFGVSAGLYHVKYSVDRMERQGLALKMKIAEEQAAMRILDAEWSSLNRPERLQKLSARYLQLAPVEVVQVVNFDQIPERSTTEPTVGAGALVASAPSEAPIKSLAKSIGSTPVVSMVELR